MKRITEIFFEKLNESWFNNTSKDYRNHARLHLTGEDRFLDMVKTVGEKGIVEILENIDESMDETYD